VPGAPIVGNVQAVEATTTTTTDEEEGIALRALISTGIIVTGLPRHPIRVIHTCRTMVSQGATGPLGETACPGEVTRMDMAPITMVYPDEDTFPSRATVSNKGTPITPTTTHPDSICLAPAILNNNNTFLTPITNNFPLICNILRILTFHQLGKCLYPSLLRIN